MVNITIVSFHFDKLCKAQRVRQCGYIHREIRLKHNRIQNSEISQFACTSEISWWRFFHSFISTQSCFFFSRYPSYLLKTWLLNQTGVWNANMLYSIHLENTAATVAYGNRVYELSNGWNQMEELNNLMLLFQCHSRPTVQAYLGLPTPQVSQTRGCWMKVRGKHWWDRVVLRECTDEDWKLNFRMSLCDLVNDIMKPEDNPVRQPIPLKMQVAIVLYKLASCAEYRVLQTSLAYIKSYGFRIRDTI